MVTKVTEETFENEVLKSELPVLVDCYADWCGPCRMMSPVLEKMAEKYEGKLKVCKVNVDDESAIAMQYRVMSIPNFIFFKDGQNVKNIVGGMSAKDFEQNIIAFLG